MDGETVILNTNSITNVGSTDNTYTIGWSGTGSATAKASNYLLASESLGTLTVTKKAVTITLNNGIKSYGKADPAFTGTVEGLVADGDIGTVTYYRTNTAEAAGVYKGVLNAKYTENGNYDVKVNKGDFEITAADAMKIAATDLTATYNGEAHASQPTVNITEGTTLSYSIDGGKTYTAELPTLTDRGTVSIRVKAENPNYTTAYAAYTITVDPAEVKVTVLPAEKTYGNADPAFTAAVTGVVSGESAEKLITYSLARDAGEKVGSYTITASGAADQGNYHVTYAEGTLSIKQRVLELAWSISSTAGKASGSSVVYNGLTETASAVFTNLVSWDGVEDSVSISGYTGDVSAIDVASCSAEIAGITGADAGNYVLGVTGFDWEITPKPIADSTRTKGYAEGISVANIASVTYDGRTHKPKAVVTDALIDGGKVLVEGVDYTLTYQKNTDAGTATVLITGIGNYKDTIKQTFTIKPMAVILEWNDDSFGYDGKQKAVTAIVTNAAGDDDVSVSSYQNNTKTNADTYTAEALGLTGEDAANYTLTNAENTAHEWTITPASIKVTADSKSSVEGSDLKELTFTVTGTVYGNDSIGTVTVTTDAGTEAGSYTIKVDVANANPNYIITTADGIYTVTAAGEKTPIVVPDGSIDATIPDDDDTRDKVLTDEDKEAEANGETVEIRVVVDDQKTVTKPEDIQKDVEEAFKPADETTAVTTEVVKVIDITVEKKVGDSDWTPTGNPNGSVQVTIPVPEVPEDRTGHYELVKIDGSGVTKMDNLSDDPSAITVEVDDLDSEYALVFINDEEVPLANVTAGVPCYWHWFIVLADVVFAIGLLVTMKKVDKDLEEEERRKKAKKSRIFRIIALAGLLIFCIIMCILGYCKLEIPFSVISMIIMIPASILLYKRKFKEDEDKSEQTAA